jgi:hypothetical protein
MFLNSRLNYFHAKTNRIVKVIPISIEQPYFYQFVTFRGDRNAVDSQVLAKLPINNKPLPFPTLADLIHLSEEQLAAMVFDALKDNDRIIRNSD